MGYHVTVRFNSLVEPVVASAIREACNVAKQEGWFSKEKVIIEMNPKTLEQLKDEGGFIAEDPTASTAFMFDGILIKTESFVRFDTIELREVKGGILEMMRLAGVPSTRPTAQIETIYSNTKKNTTTVMWADGTHTTVKKAKGTKDDIYSAVSAALAIKVYGNNSRFKKMIEEKTQTQGKKK